MLAQGVGAFSGVEVFRGRGFKGQYGTAKGYCHQTDYSGKFGAEVHFFPRSVTIVLYCSFPSFNLTPPSNNSHSNIPQDPKLNKRIRGGGGV